MAVAMKKTVLCVVTPCSLGDTDVSGGHNGKVVPVIN
jgi:hypothetical protein